MDLDETALGPLDPDFDLELPPFYLIPQELILKIWSHVHPDFLLSNATVCKTWNELLNNQNFWFRSVHCHYYLSRCEGGNAYTTILSLCTHSCLSVFCVSWFSCLLYHVSVILSLSTCWLVVSSRSWRMIRMCCRLGLVVCSHPDNSSIKDWKEFLKANTTIHWETSTNTGEIQ